MHSAIKHMQITTKLDQISEGNISMQSTSRVLKKMSSRAHRPAAQKGTEYILEANPSLHCWKSALPDSQVTADIWLFKKEGGKRLCLSFLLS